MRDYVDPAAAAAAIPPGRQSIEVTGDGPLAHALREMLGSAADPGTGDARPAVVVETTGSPEAIRAALERVADLGTIVLAGPVAAAPVALDAYPDLHVRGLTVVGVPAPAHGQTDVT